MCVFKPFDSYFALTMKIANTRLPAVPIVIGRPKKLSAPQSLKVIDEVEPTL